MSHLFRTVTAAPASLGSGRIPASDTMSAHPRPTRVGPRVPAPAGPDVRAAARQATA